MPITQQEITNFISQINISPNIIDYSLQTLCESSKDNSSVRIYYYINENDEIIMQNEEPEKYNDFLFYEIIIIKIDFVKNKSKMIMIYNNEKKQYKIKIWASKLEKLDIKAEYNKIVKKICEKKTGNNILKNVLKLIPDKYTIYYFPLTVSLFEKELVFLYILIFTINEKSKFQNFKQIKDLVLYSKTLLIPKIYNILLKYKNNNLKTIKNSNKSTNTNTINSIKSNYKINYILNDNKENIFVKKNQKQRNNDYMSPNNKEIHINFDKKKLKRIISKKIKKYSKRKVNYMKKPYNKIIFNYSFEKNDNEINFNRIKHYQKSFIEQRKPISTIIIDTYKNKTSKVNNFMKFPINKLKKLNNGNLLFSIASKNNKNDNNSSLPYEKKRPSSIPRKINHYLSTNNFNIQYRNHYNENESDLNEQYNYSTFDKKCLINKKKNIIYKKKSFTKKRNQNTIDSYFYKNINSNNILENNNSTYDNLDIDTIFSMDRNSVILNKNKKNKSIFHNGPIVSMNPLIKTYGCIKDINEKHNIAKIPINKKTTLSINFNKYVNQSPKNDFNYFINEGSKTSRNIMNKKIRKKILYKNNEKNILNKTGDSNRQKMNDSEEEITLFI